MLRPEITDTAPGRSGYWMHTASGGRFFPEDPRPEEVRINDIANGLAQEVRYNGQGDIHRHYSVAEHSHHISWYAKQYLDWPPDAQLYALLHDAPEAFIKDLARAAKRGAGEGYAAMEERVGEAILRRYDLLHTALRWHQELKLLDSRIITTEKRALMRHPQPWACDQLEPLPVQICFWRPPAAKQAFLARYTAIAQELGMEIEEYEL